MNESLVKYLSGLLDADGSLSFNFKCDKNRLERYFISLQLKLSGSDAVDPFGFIENLPGTTGMGISYREGRNKQFVVWVVAKRADLEMLLPRLIKHQVIKAKHWQWMLDKWRELRSENKTCSKEEREMLTLECKKSRLIRTGPIKPKNHPTWAWLAGYLDGDGSYTFRRNFNKRDQKINLHMKVSAVAHANDTHVLRWLKQHFGGYLSNHGQSKNVDVWTRSLGANNRSFALRFLPKLVKHSRLKRHKIEQMIAFSRQQRLSVPAPSGEATV